MCPPELYIQSMHCTDRTRKKFLLRSNESKSFFYRVCVYIYVCVSSSISDPIKEQEKLVEMEPDIN